MLCYGIAIILPSFTMQTCCVWIIQNVITLLFILKITSFSRVAARPKRWYEFELSCTTLISNHYFISEYLNGRSFYWFLVQSARAKINHFNHFCKWAIEISRRNIIYSRLYNNRPDFSAFFHSCNHQSLRLFLRSLEK